MDDSAKLIFVLRHGQCAESVHPKFRSQYPIRGDSPLTELGELQSQRSSHLLSHLIPSGKTVKIVTSPYLGCVQTAMYLSSQFKTRITIDWGLSDFLNPIHFSSTPTELTYSTEWFNSKYQQDYIVSDTAKPEFPETYERMELRTNTSFLNYANNLEEDALIVITHFFGIEVLTALMKENKDRIVHEGYCALTVSELKNGKYTVRVNADYTHAPQYIKHDN